jgi:hypothetical protein
LLNKEKEKLKLLYERIIAVILFLCSRNLAFRGSDDHIGSNNNGNFLGLLELLAKYDVFLADYLSNIRESNVRIQHHLSNRFQNRLLQDLSEEVLKTVLNNVRIAKYYSLQMDSTPDVSHKEQT